MALQCQITVLQSIGCLVPLGACYLSAKWQALVRHVTEFANGLLGDLLGLSCICVVAEHNAQACGMQAACLTQWTPSVSVHEVTLQAPAIPR